MWESSTPLGIPPKHNKSFVALLTQAFIYKHRFIAHYDNRVSGWLPVKHQRRIRISTVNNNKVWFVISLAKTGKWISTNKCRAIREPQNASYEAIRIMMMFKPEPRSGLWTMSFRVKIRNAEDSHEVNQRIILIGHSLIRVLAWFPRDFDNTNWILPLDSRHDLKNSEENSPFARSFFGDEFAVKCC